MMLIFLVNSSKCFSMETKKNVGIWIRVSTDQQVQDDSPEHHERRARLYAESKGWNVVTVYRLEALSGKSIMHYSETKRMINDVVDGVITGLVFSKLARVARNTKQLLEIAEIFREHNADLISLMESIDTSTPAGRLFFTVIAAMATWEREEIAERVAASVPIRANMGKPLGGQASFGYKWEGKQLIIDEQEAPIRKRLYEIFLQTKRKKATATELNNLGYRTRNGSKFSDTTVARLLRDPSAKGLRRANYTKSLGEGKQWIIKPKSEWVEIPCPSIISTDIWEECNSILEQQEKKRTPKGPRTVYLLSGYVYCDCGAKMYVYTESPVYKCKKCRRKIDVGDLDEIFHEQLKSFLFTEADIERITGNNNSLLSEKQTLLKTISSKYAGLKKRMTEIVNLRLDAEMSKEEFASYYKPIAEQVRQLEQQIPDVEAEIYFLKIQYLSTDTVIEEAKDLYNRWFDMPFEERRTIIEIITEKITINNSSIDITLSYFPTPTLSPNGVKSQRNFMDS
jgi:site-specific DNA recombinase